MFSQHPVGGLIRRLVDAGREITPEDAREIVGRMATAPFHREMVRVPTKLRGLAYSGRTLGAREETLFVHLVQRVLVDGQWAVGTAADQYLADLRRAVRWPAARLGLFVRQGGYLATTICPTNEVVPIQRRGVSPLPFIVVVYSAEWGALITGYQFSAIERLNIPPETLWLR